MDDGAKRSVAQTIDGHFLMERKVVRLDNTDDSSDECEIDEQPTLKLPVKQIQPPEMSPDEMYPVDTIIQQARTRYLDRERQYSNREFCPVCWRYAHTRGVEDTTIYLFPRPCEWHAQAIIEAKNPATKVWLIRQYQHALMQYLWPPGLREAVDRLGDGGDDRRADDGTK